MIAYHGFPVGLNVNDERTVFSGRHCLVSFAHKTPADRVFSFARSVILDNGAFSAWKAEAEYDFEGYAAWVRSYYGRGNFDFAIIPDVIDGSEERNDELVTAWPAAMRRKAAPVWHLHESTERLERLCRDWPLVCVGSSGQYRTPGTVFWWKRMSVAWQAVPAGVKIHGLRMLNPDITSRIPLWSADSVTAGRNSNMESRWNDPVLRGCRTRTRTTAYCEYLENVPPALDFNRPDGATDQYDLFTKS